MNHFMLDYLWDGESVEDDLQQWYDGQKIYGYLLFFMLKEVWKARNGAIFNHQFQKASFIFSKIISSFSNWNKEKTSGNLKFCSFPSILMEHPMGFFDGETLKGVCGVGLVSKGWKGYSFKCWMKAGRRILELNWSPYGVYFIVQKFGVCPRCRFWEIHESL